MGPDAMILAFWILSYKPAFALSSFTLFKRLFSFCFLIRIGVICISTVIDISPSSLDSCLCFILSWFGVHQSILHCWGDISVLIVLWQSCLGPSRVQSSKSRLLICLIGKTQLLCTQCRGIGPHLVARGKSHGFSWVAARTWGIFSSYDGDANS